MAGKKVVASAVQSKKQVPVSGVRAKESKVAADPRSSKKVARGTVHSHYREISVVQTDGAIFKVRSTYKHDILKLDIDIKTHPAWTKEAHYVNTRNSEVAKFNSKFGGLSFGLKK